MLKIGGRKVTGKECVSDVLKSVIGELSSESHRNLASSIIKRLEHVNQDDQLDALERVIREMVNATDVLQGGE